MHDRLIRELKRVKIDNMKDANEFLRVDFLVRHNQKYSISAESLEDKHTPLGSNQELSNLFYFEETRKLRNDWSITYNHGYACHTSSISL